MFVILCGFTTYGQRDALYYQYLFNPQVLNPAFTGSEEKLIAKMVNRNQWYREEARLEHARLTGDEKEKFATILGQDELESMIEVWQAMQVVLDTGEHCPHHFRARKPL